MKIFKLFNLALVASCLMLLASCDNNDDSENKPDPISLKGDIGNGTNNYRITKDTTFAKGIYNLKGWVYVVSGVTVKFEPGTIIKGDKATRAALIIEPGAKIMAQGTVSEPIVFTSAMPKGSRKPGDWSGVIICGKAKNNSGDSGKLTIEGGPTTVFGGNDDNDNSGVFSYVRIEFGGYPFEANKEINGLTLGSVGRMTKLDHIQVSYSADDSFEWFGGTVNAKQLVAYHGWDDDFDTDSGFSGKLQYLLGVRHPKIADYSLSNGFESDNDKDGTTTIPKTSAIFSNVTLVGPIGQFSDFANTGDYINGGGLAPVSVGGGPVPQTGLFQAAMQIRRYSQLNCFNSVAMGYPVGLLLDNQQGKTQDLATNGTLKINNVFFAQMTVVGSDINKDFTDSYSTDGKTKDASKPSFSHTYFLAQPGNKYYANITDLKLKQPNSTVANANWGPMAGSPLLNAGKFTDTMLGDAFFDKVDYIGAFKSDADGDNWLKGWTNFDPQNTDY